MFTKAMKSSIAPLFVIILSALTGGGCPPSEEKGTVATGLAISSPDYAVAGDPITVTVRAIDNGGRTVPSYSGTIQFSSSDTEAVLPDDYAFSATDEGAHTFTALTTLKTSGPQTLTVASGSDFSANKMIIVTGGALNELLLSVPITTVAAGASVSMTVTAIDAYGNTISTYTGAVTFTSTDLKATFTTGSYSFKPADDMGTHTFIGSFGTAGSQDICAKDIVADIFTCSSVYIYWTLDLVDGGYNPITTLSVPTGTTTLNAYLLVDGIPIAGRIPLPEMTVSAGTSATLTAVTDATGGIYSADLTDPVAETVTVTTTDSVSGAKGFIEVTFY